MKKTKQEVVTFKADESLLEALRGMPNRSEFIRNAILTSLERICPTCKGTGTIPADSPIAVAGHQGTERPAWLSHRGGETSVR